MTERRGVRVYNSHVQVYFTGIGQITNQPQLDSIILTNEKGGRKKGRGVGKEKGNHSNVEQNPTSRDLLTYSENCNL